MGGTALAGALMGSQRSNETQQYQKFLGPESALYQQTSGVLGSGLTDFQHLVNAGPGQADQTAALDSTHSLAAMLGAYSQNGFLPTQADYGVANQQTQAAFAPQQLQLQQAFQDQNIQGNRQAALMGRAPNDPVLQNMLMKEQTRQQAQLGSQMTQYSSQLANQLPQQRLAFAQQLAQVNNGLATQAMQNRQALLGMGQQLRSGEQNYQIGGASQTLTQSGGGGLQGAIGGALAGLGMGAKFAGAFGSPSSKPTPIGGAGSPLGGDAFNGSAGQAQTAFMNGYQQS